MPIIRDGTMRWSRENKVMKPNRPLGRMLRPENIPAYSKFLRIRTGWQRRYRSEISTNSPGAQAGSVAEIINWRLEAFALVLESQGGSPSGGRPLFHVTVPIVICVLRRGRSLFVAVVRW